MHLRAALYPCQNASSLLQGFVSKDIHVVENPLRSTEFQRHELCCALAAAQPELAMYTMYPVGT